MKESLSELLKGMFEIIAERNFHQIPKLRNFRQRSLNTYTNIWRNVTKYSFFCGILIVLIILLVTFCWHDVSKVIRFKTLFIHWHLAFPNKKLKTILTNRWTQFLLCPSPIANLYIAYKNILDSVPKYDLAPSPENSS